MRKVLIPLSVILSTALSVGLAFWLSSSIPSGRDEQMVDPLAEHENSTFEELVSSSQLYEDDAQYDVAIGLAKLAMERAGDDVERSQAGHQMGILLYHDALRGGGSQLDAASTYLQGAIVSAPTDKMRIQVGWDLLNVLDEMDDRDLFLSYLNDMKSRSDDEDVMTRLWEREFNFLFKENAAWPKMNKHLANCEQLPYQSEKWNAMLDSIKLRIDEKLLEDSDWFLQYTGTQENESPWELRLKLKNKIQSALAPILKAGTENERETALIRLARANIFTGDYEKANAYLRDYLSLDPQEHLKEALELMDGIVSATGLRGNSDSVAASIVRRLNFDRYSLADIIEVVDLLEKNGYIDDALYIIYGFFKMNGEPTHDSLGLLARSVILEELKSQREKALEQMLTLRSFGRTDELGMALKRFIDICIERSDYVSAEKWLKLFLPNIPTDSQFFKDALFLLFDTEYWLNHPMLEQLYVGSTAVQHSPNDSRVAPVVLRMAKFVEDLNLAELALSYYNRIGLLNFFDQDAVDMAATRNIGEQAMLGKARCLIELKDWGGADHLLRDLCNRTDSPLIKSEAAIRWAELALKFGQKRESERRYNLVDIQMLSEKLKARYLLGRSRLGENQQLREVISLEESIDLLYSLPADEQRAATIDFFNESFEELSQKKNERGLRRLIDLAHQSEFAKWIPIQSYTLKMLESEFNKKQLKELGSDLREEAALSGGAILELAQMAEQLDSLNSLVERHRKKGEKNEG